MKTVIIGAGDAGRSHASAAERLDVKIAGVFDADAAVASALAARHGTATVLDSASLPAALERADMIHLCTPPSERIQYVRLAAEAGCHVLIEKPISHTLADAEEMIALCREHDLRLMVCFNHRYRYAMQRLITMVRAGAIGRVRSIQFVRTGDARPKDSESWRAQEPTASGMTVESLVHELDTLLELVDSVESVFARVQASNPGMPFFDDYADVLLGLSDGAQANVHLSWASALTYGERSVIGELGAIRVIGGDQWDFDEYHIQTVSNARENAIILHDRFPAHRHYSFDETNRRFLTAIREGSDPESPGERGAETLRIALAVLESARTGLPVHLRELEPAVLTSAYFAEPKVGTAP